MASKADDKKVAKIGDVVETGTLPDGRPFSDIFLAEGKVYRLTRIFVSESDAAWDAAQGPEDGKFNWRLNNRLQLASSIVQPTTTIDDMDKLTAVELSALLRAFDDLNNLPPADASGNA